MSTYNNRYQGFLKAIKEYDLSIAEKCIIHTDTSKKDVTKAIQGLMQLNDRPTGICAGSDSLALYLMDDAIYANLSIPEDISIIGIDNVDISQHASIQLTTVGSISNENLGLLAIHKLIELIENKKNSCVKITESVKVFNRRTTRKI